MDFLPVNEQLAQLQRGTAQIYSAQDLHAKLTHSFNTGIPLRIKYGADPSAPDLHLGHTVPLRKLRQFQDLGHTVVFIIGDFTARVGDPSHKSQTRPMLSLDTIMDNARTYQQQVMRILDPAKTEVRFNSEWLEPMGTQGFLTLASQYTIARLLEREDFHNRYTQGKPISLVEFMYPLLQGWDSVVLRADVEIGGTDQTFNLLVGRELQTRQGQAAQAVLTLPLLEGTDGVQKMSKSLGNAIGVLDRPEEMFGKIMSLPDELMMRYAKLVAHLDDNVLDQWQKNLDQGVNPRHIKAFLAERIVTLFHDAQAATAAHEHFNKLFRHKQIPDEMPCVHASGSDDVVALLLKARLVESKSAARRAIQAGAIKIDQIKIDQIDWRPLEHADVIILQNGKRHFAKIIRTL